MQSIIHDDEMAGRQTKCRSMRAVRQKAICLMSKGWDELSLPHSETHIILAPNKVLDNIGSFFASKTCQAAAYVSI
jgi:hypothetical protein